MTPLLPTVSPAAATHSPRGRGGRRQRRHSPVGSDSEAVVEADNKASGADGPAADRGAVDESMDGAPIDLDGGRAAADKDTPDTEAA